MNIKSFYRYWATAFYCIALYTPVNAMALSNAKWADECYQSTLKQHGSQNAQAKYQQLAREAVGLFNLTKQAPKVSLSVKKMAPTSPSYSAAACHQDGVIFVNEEHLDQLQY